MHTSEGLISSNHTRTYTNTQKYLKKKENYEKKYFPVGSGTVWLIGSPQFMLAHYGKANEVKRRGQKNIQNKAIQTKLNSYINEYIKKGNITNIRI